MKITRPFILLAALLCATASRAADFSVATDSELRAAIQNDKANITVTADIDLSNSTLSIESGLTVTINLGGHTLDRKLNSRDWENGGQVFTVRNGATLNLSNGTITGGWGGDSGGINNEGGTANLTNVIITGCTGDDRGGGICNRSGGTLTMTGGSITNNTSNDHTTPEGGGGLFNAEGATATLTGVTITGNEAKVKGGGGICNYGTLTIDGCTITGNSCQMNGGGIWTAATATLNMQGVTTVTGNTTANSVTNNLFLKTGAVITVTGSLTGSSVGIIMETPGIFTSDYADYHSGKDPDTFFTSDETPFLMKPAGEEAGLAVHYIERSWDKDNHAVINNDRIVAGGSYTVLTNKNGDEDVYTLNEGVYVVNGSIHINNIKCTGAVKLVLCDGSTLTVKNGLKVNNYENGSVYIFSQSYGDAMGKLRVNVTSDNDEFGGAAIGGKTYGFGNQGIIEIHGGDIRAEGKDGGDAYEALFPDYYESGAGIGGGFNANGGIINIYGGKIEAIGYGSEPGIGSGSWHSDSNKGGELTIYDGDITATAKENGPGIGGNSYDAVAGYITIHGGRIKAYGTTYGAGIGGGDDHGSPDILITGGEIYAYGGEMAAGIGSGAESTINMGVKSNNITITGGHVEAYGGQDGAGIGGGDSGDCGPVTITGGYVYAKGKDYGAGIGGGEDGDGGNVTITGGTVHASAGSGADDNNAIGAGIGRGENGSLTIGDGMSVRVVNGSRANKGQRAGYCRDYTDIYVELCDHQGATFANHHDGSHTVDDCSYCSLVTELHTYDDDNQCTRCAEEKILLADNADNSTVINDNLNQERSVVLSGRTLYKDGSWNTLCLPFEVALADSPLKGATVKTLSTSSFADGTLTLNFGEDVTIIEVGKPYIIKWDKEKNATYIIRSYTDWNAFATTVNNGADYSGETVLLGADIVVDGNTMVGTSEKPFKGTFDGNGHTLEIHYNTTEAGTAPFRYAKNANIRNLTVTGHITTSAKFAASLISHSQGTTSIDNCHSNVTITSTVEGEGKHGGFIASIDDGSATLTNCLFDGELLGEKTYGWGGLIGWKEVYLDKAYFNNCLINPSEVSLYGDLNYTIIYSKSMPNTPLNHAYYKTGDFTHEQGTDARNMSNAELLSALGDGWEISGGKLQPKKVYDSNITNPVFEGVTISSNTEPAVETDYVDFCGTYGPVGFLANDRTMLYMGADNTLYYPNRNLYIYAFRGYFQLKGITAGDLPGQARAFNMNFEGNGTTSISSLTPSSTGEDSEHWYTLDGRRLSGKPTQKGIYINNGKKRVIK